MPAHHHGLVWHQGCPCGPTASPDAFSEHASSALAVALTFASVNIQEHSCTLSNIGVTSLSRYGHKLPQGKLNSSPAYVYVCHHLGPLLVALIPECVESLFADPCHDICHLIRPVQTHVLFIWIGTECIQHGTPSQTGSLGLHPNYQCMNSLKGNSF